MSRFRDSVTGSIVNVSEARAETLGPQHVPIRATQDQKTEPKKRGRPRKQ